MFFDRFCALCERKGVSCRKAVEEIGLANSIATKWKTRGTTPNGDTLVRIARYFGLTVSELMQEETEKATAPKSDGLDMDAILESMTDEQLIRFIKKASELLSKE